MFIFKCLYNIIELLSFFNKTTEIICLILIFSCFTFFLPKPFLTFWWFLEWTWHGKDQQTPVIIILYIFSQFKLRTVTDWEIIRRKNSKTQENAECSPYLHNIHWPRVPPDSAALPCSSHTHFRVINKETEHAVKKKQLQHNICTFSTLESEGSKVFFVFLFFLCLTITL